MFLLNGRGDRQDRTLDFARHAAASNHPKAIVIAGETRKALRNSFNQAQSGTTIIEEIISLPNDSEKTLEDIFDLVFSLSDRTEVLVVGMANIHTDDAEKLMAVLENDDIE